MKIERGSKMKEIFAIPAVGAIIEKEEQGKKYILIQERQKEGGGIENGMLELPAGKIREYENIFEALRREVLEETGLKIIEIKGEAQTVSSDVRGYQTISFEPFCITQNLSGGYSIILQTFCCHAEGELADKTNEAINMRWEVIDVVRSMVIQTPEKFYPMHINALRKYLSVE